MTSVDTVLDTSVRITCDREELAAKLGIVGRGVSSRTTVQILGGILLRSGPDGLVLAATDMEISLRVGLDAQAEGHGALVVPGRLLVDIVRLLPPGEVTIEHRADEGMVHVSCGSVSYALHTYIAEDFPRLPEIAREASFGVERDAF